MRRCVICHDSDVPPDDAVIINGNGSCICLRCWARHTETTVYMPRTLRLDVADAAGKD